MKPRLKLPEEEAEINILPLMNIIMLLIPFLILSMQFVKVGMIDVAIPMQCSNCEQPPVVRNRAPLNLTMSISRKGLNLLTGGLRLGADCKRIDQPSEKPAFAKSAEGYPFVAVQRCLIKLKKLYPNERGMILIAEPAMTYQTIIKAMDASRQTAQRKQLFPNIVFSAGVL